MFVFCLYVCKCLYLCHTKTNIKINAKIEIRMEQTRFTTDFFQKEMSKKQNRYLLAAKLNKSLTTIDRWIDKDDERISQISVLKAVHELFGFTPNEIIANYDFA